VRERDYYSDVVAEGRGSGYNDGLLEQKFRALVWKRPLACPFFMPARRSRDAWQHPSRLPLGAGWEGTCTAHGHPGAIPDSFAGCNLGYARDCSRLPSERKWDAVRFAMAQEGGARSRLTYVCEKDHQPAEHGTLEFRLPEGECLRPHPDPRIQKMAECFLAARSDREGGSISEPYGNGAA